MTVIAQPYKRDRARLRPGSRTSLPTNVTFVHAVWANSGPTIAFPNNTARARPPMMVRLGCATCGFHPLATESHQADARAAESVLQPKLTPTITTAAKATDLVRVNVF